MLPTLFSPTRQTAMAGLVRVALVVVPFLGVICNPVSNAVYAPPAVQAAMVTTARIGVLPDIYGVSADLLLLALLGLGYGAVHLGKTDPKTTEDAPDKLDESRPSD